MIFETSIEIKDAWGGAGSGRFTDMTIHFEIEVQDGSFDHDWAGGGTEHRTEAEIVKEIYEFEHNGRTVTFDPDSGYECLYQIEDVDLTSARDDAIREAIQAFEYPQDYYGDY